MTQQPNRQRIEAAEPGVAWAPPGGVQETSDNSLAILEHLAVASHALTTADVARLTGRHRASVYRQLEALAADGWLRAHGSPRRYEPSRRLQRLGALSMRLGRDRVREVALFQAMQLATATSGPTMLGVYENGWAYCTDAIHVIEGVAVPFVTASAMPGITSGGGRVLIAYQDDEEIQRVASAGSPQYTERTITDPAGIVAELQATRERGYAVVHDELRIGHREITFPVFDHSGAAVIAIGMLFTGNAPGAEQIKILGEYADRTSRQLGHSIVHVPFI